MIALYAAGGLTVLTATARQHQASAADCYADTASNEAYSQCEWDRANQAPGRVNAALASVLADAERGARSPGRLSFRAQIERSQELWSAWASAQCRLEGDVVMGTAGNVIEPTCLQRLDAEREQSLIDLGKALTP